MFDFPSKRIASYSTLTEEWLEIGELNKARHGHGVFIEGGQFVVVGGKSVLTTERCIVKANSIGCKVVEPVLHGFDYYPKMISVPGTYCQT